MAGGGDGGIERWSAAELTAELREFEAALRDASLAENTVCTYVGRSEMFVRWLAGGYLPRGPNDAPLRVPRQGLTNVGRQTLRGLGAELSREKIAAVLHDYQVLAGFDTALRELHVVVGEAADLADPLHRAALLRWLRAWGCRHLRVADEARTSDALLGWWRDSQPHLPPPDAALHELRATQLRSLANPYAALADSRVAGRSPTGGEVDVRFGDTAAAKTLFAVRPRVFLPWDAPIRSAFGWTGGATAYLELLQLVAETLRMLASRLTVSVADLPALFGRPASGPPKLVDEYLWVTITRRSGVGEAREVEGHQR